MQITSTFIRTVYPSFTGTEEITFTSVFTDSRKQVEQGLFVPLVGERFDGHSFVQKAVESGAIASLWQQDHPVPEDVSIPLFLVKDTLQALQTIAKMYVQKCQPIVIGVTGSNGKTTTKDMIEAVCQTTYKTYKTQGNFNNHIGLPLTILSMPEETEVLILEMGMSGFGEISLLTKLANPSIAVITNIGDSHLEQLKSRENIAKAKLEITEGLTADGVLIIDGDEPLLRQEKEKMRTISCGWTKENDWFIHHIEEKNHGLSFQLNDTDGSYYIPYLGEHNVKNATYAIAVGNRLTIPAEQIKEGLAQLVLTGMRFETVQDNRSGALLINDAYNASPTSMKAALTTFSQIKGYPKKIAVLGDMYELGANEKQMHESVVEAIDESVTFVLTVGEKSKWIHEKVRRVKPNVVTQHVRTKEEAVNIVKEKLDEKTVVLFKASRGMALETIIDGLIKEEHDHE